MTRRLAALAALGASLAAPAAAAADCHEEPVRAAPRQDLALEVVGLVNQHRASIGLGALAPSPALMRSALWKSNHMALLGYFDHADPAPPKARDFSTRMRDCGYGGGTMGENIAYGSRTAAAVMSQWLDSPGHRRNIENPEFTQIGVGTAGTSPHWTQTFGAGGGPEPANAAPAAAADAVTLAEDTTANAALTANDRDAPNEWLHVTALEERPALAVTASADGRGVAIAPARDFFGTVTLQQTVADLMGAAATTTLTVTVTPVNDAPVAASDTRTIGRRARRVLVDVLANDRDVDGDRLAVRLVRRPRYGSASVSGNRVAYRPRRRRWPGRDSFTYRAVDAEGVTASATVVLRGRRRR